MAHQLGRIGDWVVIYFHTDGEAEGQRTVVTETKRSLVGRRVVRGREPECHEYYAPLTSPDPYDEEAKAALVSRGPQA
jgi:putative hydrolase